MKKIVCFMACVAAGLSLGARDMAIYNGKLTNALNANGQAITNVATPTASGDAVTKAYVDSIAGVTPAIVTNIAQAVTAPATNAVSSALSASLASTSSVLMASLASASTAATNYTDSATNATLAAADAKYLSLVTDKNGNKTAVTIGTRWDGKDVGVNSFAQGYSVAASGDYSHAEGVSTMASGDYSHAEGVDTTASGDTSHAEGYGTTASGDYSHAEGVGTMASGDYSHAEVVNTTASGDYSHAEGVGTTASGDTSHAEGSGTTASGDISHAEGYGTTASNRYSFAWNGDDEIYPSYYGSHGDGTFNINPAGGLAGFYIGETNFVGHVTNIVNTMVDHAITTGLTQTVIATIGTNTVSVVVNDEINNLLGSNWRSTYGSGLAGLIAAILAALALLKKTKLGAGLNADGTPSDSNVVTLFSRVDTSSVTVDNLLNNAELEKSMKVCAQHYGGGGTATGIEITDSATGAVWQLTCANGIFTWVIKES